MSNATEVNALAGNPIIADQAKTGDPAIDAARQEAINSLGRALRPSEAFAIEQNEPLPGNDGIEIAEAKVYPPISDKSPEMIFAEAAESGKA